MHQRGRDDEEKAEEQNDRVADVVQGRGEDGGHFLCPLCLLGENGDLFRGRRGERGGIGEKVGSSDLDFLGGVERVWFVPIVIVL